MTERNRPDIETVSRAIDAVDETIHTNARLQIGSDGQTEAQIKTYIEPDAYVSELVSTAENHGFNVGEVSLMDATERLCVTLTPFNQE